MVVLSYLFVIGVDGRFVVILVRLMMCLFLLGLLIMM